MQKLKMTKASRCLLIGLSFFYLFSVSKITFGETAPSQQSNPIGDFAPEGTELNKYQKRLYAYVGSKWKTKVSSNSHFLAKEKVVYHFFVKPDGGIIDVEIIHGNPQSLLALMSVDSIKQSSEVFEFSDELIKECPKGFKWELSFRTY